MTVPHRSIGQVLDLLKDEFSDISISKIRFLESQGLIDPQRNQSGYRKFTEADITVCGGFWSSSGITSCPSRSSKSASMARNSRRRTDAGSPSKTEPPLAPGGPAADPLDAGAVSVTLTLDELASASA